MNDLFNSIQKTMADIHLAELIKEKNIYQHQLSGTSAYQFCPFCMKEKYISVSMLKNYFKLKAQQKRKTEDEADFIMQIEAAELHPLLEIRTKQLVKVEDNLGEIMFDTHFECSDCGKTITIEDLEKAYCSPARDDTSKKFIQLDDVKAMNSF